MVCYDDPLSTLRLVVPRCTGDIAVGVCKLVRDFIDGSCFGVYGADEGVVAYVFEVAAKAEPGSCGGDVVCFPAVLMRMRLLWMSLPDQEGKGASF